MKLLSCNEKFRDCIEHDLKKQLLPKAIKQMWNEKFKEFKSLCNNDVFKLLNNTFGEQIEERNQKNNELQNKIDQLQKQLAEQQGAINMVKDIYFGLGININDGSDQMDFSGDMNINTEE